MGRYVVRCRVSRSAFRVRVGLSGWVFDASGQTARPGHAARAVDLSRTGIGLICAGWPESGAVVRVTVEDAVDGHPVGRHWSGRVAHAREVSDGVRVGVAFEWPAGPGARPGVGRPRVAPPGARGPVGAGAIPAGGAGPGSSRP